MHMFFEEGLLWGSEFVKRKTIAFLLLFAIILTMPAMASGSEAERVISVAIGLLGTPYELKSDAPNSFNCFSFVEYCFNQVVPGTISLTGISGSYAKISSIKNLEPGDIVGFKSSKKLRGILGYHFAIYAGNGYIIHAANKTDGVTVSKLKDCRKRFIGALRIKW